MIEPTAIPEVVKRLTIATLTLSHIQFAAFLIGLFCLGVTMELFGMLSPENRPRFDGLARSLGRTAIIIYSTGAVLAIIFVLVFALTFPTFWYIVVRDNFWALFLEAITFVLTILYLFPWYYTWDALAGFKWVHLSLGLALIVVAELQQAMIDVVAGFMLTPVPPEDLLRVFLNPTSIPLDMHRLVGDVSFAGFVVAGYAAYRTLRAREPESRSYFDWVGSVGMVAGLGFLFLQPAVGIAYVEEIRANSPGAFNVMMRGGNAWLFLVLATSVSILFFLSVLYMALQVRKSGRRGGGPLIGLLIVVVLSGLLLVQPRVVGPSQYYFWANWVNPLGSMQPWKYIAFAGLTLAAIVALITYLGSQRRGLRWGQMERGGRSAQYALVALAVLASGTMIWMGYIRESSRAPFLIYYDLPIEQPEEFPKLEPTPTPPGPSSHSPDDAAAVRGS